MLAHCSLRRQKRFILDFSGSARHSRHAAVAVVVVAVASAFAFAFAAVCTFQVFCFIAMPNCSELELQTACRKPSAINRHRQPATVEPQLVCRNVSVAVAVAVAVSVSESRQSKRVRHHKRGPFMLGRSLRSARFALSSHLSQHRNFGNAVA